MELSLNITQPCGRLKKLLKNMRILKKEAKQEALRCRRCDRNSRRPLYLKEFKDT